MKIFGWLIPWWAYAIAAALALSGAAYGGWQVRAWKCASDNLDRIEDEQEARDKQLARQQNESEAYEADRNAAREESRNRETQVRTIYRDRVVPTECEPDPGAVSLLREAVDSANAPASQSSQPVRRDP